MRNFRRHANGLPKCWVWVNRLADVHRVYTHLNRQGNLTNHVARMRADHAAAQDFSMTLRFEGYT